AVPQRFKLWHPLPKAMAPSKTKTPGAPGVDGIKFRKRKRSPSDGGYIEQPSRPPQRILDLGEVANAHHLENQSIDVGFEFSQSQGAGALPPSWLPGDRSRGLLTRSSKFFASGGCLSFCGCLGLPAKVARQTQRCSRLVDEGFADGPVESGCRPRLVGRFDVALGIVVEELFQEAGLAWCGGCFPGRVGGCLPLGGCPGLPTQIAGQPQLLPHLADDGVTDRSFHP